MLLIRQPFNKDAAYPLAFALSALAFFRLYTPRLDTPSFCGFLWITGWQCPLCGMTRALCAIGHGDFHAAIAFHPLSPLTFALVIAMAATALLQLAGFPLRPPWRTSRFWIAAAAIFACFGILRIILPIAGLTL